MFGTVETVDETPAAEVVAEEFVWNSVSEETIHDPSASFADLNEVEFESSSGGDMPAADAPAASAEFTFNTQLDDSTDTATSEPDGDKIRRPPCSRNLRASTSI